MPEAVTIDDLRAKIRKPEVARAFEFLQQTLSTLPGLNCEPEKHGYMSSLRVRRGEDWAFAIAPAAEWLLFYIRKPELKRGHIGYAAVKAEFNGAEERQDGEIKVRLRDEEMARRMAGLIAAAG